MQETISIFGSCTSRDIFEFDKANRFCIKAYIARQSIISSLAAPVNLDFSAISLRSNFQKRQVINDLKKTTFDILNSSHSKYLIIDLIDERFHLLKANGSIITLSNEFSESGLMNNNFIECEIFKISNWKIFKHRKGILGYSYMFDNKLLEWYIYQFCQKILSIYDAENIIIHRAIMADQYISKTGAITHFPKHYLKYNKLINEKLNYMYDYLGKFMPNAHIINKGSKYYADENHKWGLAPMHYCDQYYIDVLFQINEILDWKEKCAW